MYMYMYLVLVAFSGLCQFLGPTMLTMVHGPFKGVFLIVAVVVMEKKKKKHLDMLSQVPTQIIQ